MIITSYLSAIILYCLKSLGNNATHLLINSALKIVGTTSFLSFSIAVSTAAMSIFGISKRAPIVFPYLNVSTSDSIATISAFVMMESSENSFL